MSFRFTHVVFALLIWSGTANALDPNKQLSQFGVEVWLTENGLPQNTVHAVTQTQNGYIWIATEGGLARYDGITFRIFDKQNTPALPSNYIRALKEDRQGNLWIGTAEGLVRLQAGNVFTRIEGLPNNSIQSLYEDRLGNVYVATSGGLMVLKGDQVTTFAANDRSVSGSIQTLFEDRDGALWIGTPYGLTRFKDGRFSSFTERDGLGSNSVRAIQQTRDGRLWFGTLSGLTVLRDGAFTTYRTRDGLNSDRILSLCADQDGTLLIGTASGMNRLNENRFSGFQSGESLSTNTILALFEDREGNIWIGTESGGISLLQDTKFSTYSTRNGLPVNLVKSVYGSSNGDIWIGTEGGGLSLLRNGQVTNYSTNVGLSSNVAISLFADSGGTLWVGTTSGLNQYRNGRFTPQRTSNGPANEYVRSIYQDRDGYLWIGTRSGLTRIKANESKTFTEADGLPNDLITALYQGSNGALWIGSLGGLTKFQNEEFTTYTTKDGLSSDLISSIYEDSNQTLWITTNGGGINRFKNGAFTAYTTKQGLIDDVIHSVLEDARDNLWFSCSKGIFRVSKSDFDQVASGNATGINSVVYGTADGMLTRECSGGGSPSAWKDNAGKLWFATIRGVAMIDPASIKTNQYAPPVVVEQLRTDDQSAIFNNNAEISPGQTRFDFYYTAPSFVAPDKIRFKYKLDGFDRDWVDAGTRRIASYTNLRPGNYRFIVIASNSDGLWNETGASFSFYLKPYFYQTTWFYILCLLVLAFIAWQIYRFRLRQMQTQFGAVLAERTRIAREIHDNLAQEMLGISVQLEVVARTLPPTAESAKSHLDRVRILVRHAIAEARRYVWDLRSQELEKSDLPKALGDTARRLTSDTGIQVQVSVHGTFRPLPRLIEENVLRLGQEAINNAVKHANAEHIFVNLGFAPKGLQLCVRDDGKGFHYDATENGTDHFGLIGMRERAERMGGTLWIYSANGSGTEIIVDVPINN